MSDPVGDHMDRQARQIGDLVGLVVKLQLVLLDAGQALAWVDQRGDYDLNLVRQRVAKALALPLPTSPLRHSEQEEAHDA